VGRVKMNMRLEPRRARTPIAHRCARTTSSPSCKALVEPASDGTWRDRRHRPSRQPPRALGRRADGEPVPHRPAAHGARHQASA
jgi:hypothetical protein